MKKVWKILGIVAVAASVPVVFRKNPETGERTVDALLWQLTTTPDPETGKHSVSLSIFPNRFPRKKAVECPWEEPASDCEQTAAVTDF